ncbi:unnamed protein product [Psylliodes chrysocephalus]|uniref:Small ribosomal subunit protein mS38 n=1 Tax=Psylliodes chrysocephalus TaxID=3402493 RepID=A0A9P0G7P7_9CUCU|nr:unnamed protein product [Psylliodes chrysocephala]
MSCLFKMFSSRILRFNKLNTLSVQFSHLHIHRTANNTVSIPLPLVEKINNYNPWIWKRNENIGLPMSKNANLNVELPNGLKYILPLIDPVANEEIEAPAVDDSIEKEAVTMIVIRRKKMKKHKLKKLRKRMKFEWAKKRQRRELKKEKEFQAQLIAQYTEAEAFSAEEYVAEKINKYKALISEQIEMPKFHMSTVKSK